MRFKVTLSLFLLLLLTAGIAVFGFRNLPSPLAATPYLPEGKIVAARIAPLALTEKNPAETDAYFAKLIESANRSGINTFLFEAHPGNTVYYRSKHFAAASTEYDALDALCRAANAKGIAVYAVVSPFVAGGLDMVFPEKTPAATASLTAVSDTRYFDPTDSTYLKLLGKELAALARRYPVAGIVLRDTDALTEPPDALLHLAAAIHKGNRNTAVGLSDFFSASSLTPLLPELVRGGFSLLLPAIEGKEECYARCCAAGAETVLPDFSLSLQPTSSYDAFFAATYPLHGAVLGTANTGDDAEEMRCRVMSASLLFPLAAQDLDVPQILTLGTPTDGEVTTQEQVLLLGTSDPALPLLLNGTELPRTGTRGTYAAFVPLTLGENTFTLTQSSNSVSAHVTRNTPKKTPPKKLPQPDTAPDTALAGRYIRISAQIASALSDPARDAAIRTTLKEGAIARIKGTVETLRSGKIATAYLLESGDAVMDYNAELLAENAGAPAELRLAKSATEGRLLTLTFAGGSPACYPSRSGDILTFDFLNASFADTALLLPEQFSAFALEPTAQGVRLTLTMAESFRLWGYDISYREGETVLRFQSAPQLAPAPAKPLEGVTVLLDAGHGGTDTGAPGLSGLAGGLCEKDVNLALTKVVREKLTQLGANVLMTREDDSFPTLQERYAQTASALPDFYIALHHNSVEYVQDTNQSSGVECYYFEPESKEFASSLLRSVSCATLRAISEPENAYFYVTRQSICRSVLFEFGYLVNPAEFETCFSASEMRREAIGVANGILALLA